MHRRKMRPSIRAVGSEERGIAPVHNMRVLYSPLGVWVRH